MPREVDVHEAEIRLSRLLAEVERGGEVVITRAGEPVARLVLLREEIPRIPGVWRGRGHVADDFDELPEEVAAAFRGELPYRS